MGFKISLVMICYNGQSLLEKSLRSVGGLVDEIIIVDNYSNDDTVAIAKKFTSKVFLKKSENLGNQRAFALAQATCEWILILDSDEIISRQLKKEIKQKIKFSSSEERSMIKETGFYIPFQNHFLGRPLFRGGENYKMLRLFKKTAVEIKPALVHEKFILKKGRAGQLKNKIYHYSYRSIRQMFSKFTDYAKREARQKAQKGEKSSFKKLFLYPLHMFWARFIKDQGYKDGLFRLPLDLGFAYMEFLTYFFLLIDRRRN